MVKNLKWTITPGSNMADQTSQDIKELEKLLHAFHEKSLAAIAQKQDSHFQELKKLILLNSRTSPRSTADSDREAKLSSSEVDCDSKTAEIPRFDGSTEDEDHPNSTFIREDETRSKLPPSPPPTWKYDVFVSFRGKDTRRGFASHLFEAFKREGINCYRDIDGNERGQEVGSMLIEAIRQSKMAIILFSPNYADSKWCLDELVEILSCNNRHGIHGHMVLPIFYNVEPSNVRHQKGMIGKAFKRCIVENKEQNKENIWREGMIEKAFKRCIVENKEQNKENIWREALKQAGRISSWSLNNRDEAEIIKEIVDELLKRVAYSRSPDLAKSSIVPNDNVHHLISMVETRRKNVVRTIGICGTEGVGKTTLANAACVHLRKVFEERVILLDVSHVMEIKNDLLHIQSKIVTELLKMKLSPLSEDTEKNVLEIRMGLSQKKVLIILDNVTRLEEVELVLGKDYEKYLGLGSRVLITSRDWELLDELNVDDFYMVPPLSHEDSLKLFYHYAFMGRQQEVNDIKRYEELSKIIVHYAAGLPPVLKSLGYSLSNADDWNMTLRDLVRSKTCGDTKVYRCGPFGALMSVEYRWDDGEHCDVRGIELVVERSDIVSIGVTYDNYGHPVGPLFHGSSSSSSTVLPQKVELDYPHEYLMSISGFIGKTKASRFTTLRSLTLHSNKRTLGPFGDDSNTGQPFSTQPTGAKIVGFFGANGCILRSIGVHAKQVSHTYPHHQVGPFGEIRGLNWDHGAFTDIRKIIITQDYKSIVSVNCVYDNNGFPVEELSHPIRIRESSQLSPHIQASRYDQVEVTLNYPTEFILSISGYYYERSDSERRSIKSLTFRTNLTTHGPYGYETGVPFSTPLELGKIVGFYGTEDTYIRLQSIGAYFAPFYHMHPLTTIKPFGDVFSKTWDDGKHSGVKRIDIHHSLHIIQYMRFTYVDSNGGTIRGRKLGRPDRKAKGYKEVIELESSKEYLVSIFGRMGFYNAEEPSETNYITSLSFETNLGNKFGPYGHFVEGDKPFSFKSNRAKIVGFHGTFDTELGAYSIGPHLQLL